MEKQIDEKAVKITLNYRNAKKFRKSKATLKNWKRHFKKKLKDDKSWLFRNQRRCRFCIRRWTNLKHRKVEGLNRRNVRCYLLNLKDKENVNQSSFPKKKQTLNLLQLNKKTFLGIKKKCMINFKFWKCAKTWIIKVVVVVYE